MEINNTYEMTTQNVMQNLQEIQSLAQNIQTISSRTNILSLNASIEAARSGEAGRGFAVVAHQMSGLAKDSKEASAQILGLIAQLSSDMDKLKKEIDKLQSSAQGSEVTE